MNVNLKLGATMLVVAVTLSGCLSVNSAFNNKSIKEIETLEEAKQVVKIGMTKRQVEERLGTPNTKETWNNDELWRYSSMKSSIFIVSFDMKSLIVTFGPNDRVKDIRFNNLDNKYS